jgi:hypothetical protein
MKLVITAFISFLHITLIAQIVELPEISIPELTNDKFNIDSAANAVVLIEKGLTNIQRSDADRALMVFHQYAVRTKI